MAGTGHKSIRPGKQALIRFKNGTTTVDKFLEDLDRYLVFERLGRVMAVTIATVSEYRPVEGSMLRGEDLKRICALCEQTYQAREAAKMIYVADKPVCRGCARQIAEAIAL